MKVAWAIAFLAPSVLGMRVFPEAFGGTPSRVVSFETFSCSPLLFDAPEGSEAENLIAEYYEALIKSYRAQLGSEERFLEWVGRALEKNDYFDPPVIGGGGILWEYLSKLEKVAKDASHEEAIRGRLKNLVAGVSRGVETAKEAVRETRSTGVLEKLGLSAVEAKISLDEKWLLFQPLGTSDRTRLVDLETRKTVFDFPQGMEDSAVIFRSDSKEAVRLSGDEPPGITFWNLETGGVRNILVDEKIQQWIGEGTSGSDWISYDPEKRRILIRSSRRSGNLHRMLILDLDTGRILKEFEAPVGLLETAVNWESSSAVVRTGDELRYFDGEKGTTLVARVSSTQQIVDWALKKIYLATGSGIETFELPPPTGKPWVGTTLYPDRDVREFVLNDERTRAMVLVRSGHARIIDLKTKQTLSEFSMTVPYFLRMRGDFGRMVYQEVGSAVTIVRNLETGSDVTLVSLVPLEVTEDFSTLFLKDAKKGELLRFDLTRAFVEGL